MVVVLVRTRTGNCGSQVALPRRHQNVKHTLCGIPASSARLSLNSRLDDQDIEHHHRIEGRSHALRSIRVGERCIQFRAKDLEIHCRPERFELVAEIAQPLQPIIDVK
jgi:hypothetical protein